MKRVFFSLLLGSFALCSSVYANSVYVQEPLPASAHTPPYLGSLLTLPNGSYDPNGTTKSLDTKNTTVVQRTYAENNASKPSPSLSEPPSFTAESASQNSNAKQESTVLHNKELIAKIESQIDPYALEQEYLQKKHYTTQKQKPKPQKKYIIRKQVPQQKTTNPHSLLLSERSSQYNTSNRFNIQYNPKSPLKMITFQIFVSINESPRTVQRVKRLLTNINNALPRAELVMGLYNLNAQKPTYILSRWNRQTFTKAIETLSSSMPKGPLGVAFRGARPELLNIPAPVALLLVSDGYDTNPDNLAFDIKLFYAPDPFAPIHIVSFASTKAEQRHLALLQSIHKSSKIYDGKKLLSDSTYFAAFMKALYVK